LVARAGIEPTTFGL